MKLLSSASSIALAITLSLTSVVATANNVVLKPINENIETQACYTAATQGLNAAKELVSKENINFGIFKNSVTCNGLSLVDFAQQYGEQSGEQNAKSEATETRIVLVAKNTNVESQLCLDAITMGERAAREKHAIDLPVTCNNLDLADFVRSYKKQEVLVRTTAD